jgi:peptide/nickel transport system substrate-binding protein
MLRQAFVWLIVGTVATLLGAYATAQSKPEGQLIIAFDTSIAATYFDPAETPGIQTPFVFLYALHDALVKPLPGNDMAPCLAESWSESPDGLVYEFKLREGVTFHNGDPFTTEDVKFSFLRYKSTSAKLLHERVKAVEVIDAHRLRYVLHTPWPDFLTFYATPATGAAWVVPKTYLEQVGDDGFKRHPVGLGPYRFVRSDPGVELVLEANERYWRKMPSIKRIIYEGIPESPTRLAMLKTEEAVSTGTYAYGGYPDIDDLFRQQAVERDHGKREALLHQIQRLMQERVMYAAIFDSVPLHGVGPRVEEPAVGLNPLLYFTAPYEDMRLKRP